MLKEGGKYRLHAVGEGLGIGDTKINTTEPFLLRGPEEQQNHVTVVCRALPVVDVCVWSGHGTEQAPIGSL